MAERDRGMKRYKIGRKEVDDRKEWGFDLSMLASYNILCRLRQCADNKQIAILSSTRTVALKPFRNHSF
jgi:hypothetical protein